MKTEETDKCVTSIQEVDSKRRRVFINYEPAFVLYISEIRRFNIKKDAYISLEDYEDIIDILNKYYDLIKNTNIDIIKSLLPINLT